MRRFFQLALVAAACVAALSLLVLAWAAIASSLAGFFGFSNGSGNGSHYLFWSGAGSDLAYLTMAGGALVYYRRNNCKRAWCPFIGHYDFTDPVDNVSRKLCWIHHPDVRYRTLKPQHIQGIQERRLRDLQKRFHIYVGDRPGKG